MKKSAAFWFLLFNLGPMLVWVLLIYTFFCTKLWWVVVIYAIWIYLDRNTPEAEGRRIEFFRKLSFWRDIRDYFPIRLHKLPGAEFDSTKNYLFCYFPHGLLTLGAMATFGIAKGQFNEVLPNLKPHVCALKQFFYLPVVREMFMAMGSRAPSVESLNYILSKPGGGNAVALIVGGAAESYHAKPGQYKLVLKNRKGFAKVALRNGSPLVPLFSFGENDLYDQVNLGDDSWLRKGQEALRKIIGFPLVIPRGRSKFSLLPFQHPLNQVVGHPIPVKKTENPTQSEIDDLHKKFVEALISLFESEKHKYIKNAENIHIELV